MTVYVNGEGQNTTNSAGIVDGSIVNADINSSAAIAASKISGTALVASTADAKGDLYVASAADTVGRLAVGADGSVPTANSGDTAGIGYAYPDIGGLSGFYRASSSVKACTVSPMLCTTAATLSDGNFVCLGIYLPFDATLTGVTWVQVTQGDTTADNENRVGLYTSDGTNLTLVASSTDDGALWETAGANTVGQKAFSSTYPAQAGRYWIGILSNWSAVATAPQIRNCTSVHASLSQVLMNDSDEAHGFTVAAQATLPATQAWSGVTPSGSQHFLGVY